MDPKSRTLRVRLAFDNPEGLLKANMFADVVIYAIRMAQMTGTDLLEAVAKKLVKNGAKYPVAEAKGKAKL